jgi:hypothetical protein
LIIDVDVEGRDDFECAWDPWLSPFGGGNFHEESFDTWWSRCRHQLNGLHPMIAEQWIYRHWNQSPFRDLPLAQLAWRQESWRVEDIFNDVFVRPCYIRDFADLDLEGDFKQNHRKTCEPFKSLNTTGTWDFPIVVIHTPDGVRANFKHLPEVRFCLIEGHRRFRFLIAWEGRAFTADRHAVFVLSMALPSA